MIYFLCILVGFNLGLLLALAIKWYNTEENEVKRIVRQIESDLYWQEIEQDLKNIGNFYRK